MWNDDNEQSGKYMVALSRAAVFEVRHGVVMASDGGVFEEHLRDSDHDVEIVFEGLFEKPTEPGLWVFDGWCSSTDPDGHWNCWKGAWRRPSLREMECLACGLHPFKEKHK